MNCNDIFSCCSCRGRWIPRQCGLGDLASLNGGHWLCRASWWTTTQGGMSAECFCTLSVFSSGVFFLKSCLHSENPMPEANSDAGGEQMGKWISATVARPAEIISISFRKMKLQCVVRVSFFCSMSGLLGVGWVCFCRFAGRCLSSNEFLLARESSFSGNVLPIKRLTERAPYTILEEHRA